MIRLFVRHSVADYSQWRQAYDATAARRPELGVTDDAIFIAVDDQNDVTVSHDFDSEAAAQAFVERLPAMMEEAGVAGSAQIWLTTPV